MAKLPALRPKIVPPMAPEVGYKFTDPLKQKAVLSTIAYLPQVDYKARNYEPIGKRTLSNVPGQQDVVEGPEEHFCKRCHKYYGMVIEEGLVDPNRKEFKGRSWPINCWGDRSKQMDIWTDEALDKLIEAGIGPEDTPEARDYFKVSYDPVRWASYEFNVDADWYQAEMLRCSSQWKAVRAGRRVGKTYAMCLDIWHKAFTKEGKDIDKYEILVICPYEAQVKKIFDDLLSLLSNSKKLKESYKRHAKQPWEIELKNGTIIRGFSAGKKTGAKSDKVRGQGANAIYFDEIDYMSDDDIETILAVLGSTKDTSVWMSSTPTGARTKLWIMCHDKNLRYKEFHFISGESPRWSDDVEIMLRAIYSEGGFSREFHAEFGSPTEGVFRQDDIDKCLRDYKYSDMRRHPDWFYVVGVDWNKTTGTHIIVLECGLSEKTVDGKVIKEPFFRLVDKEIIRRGEFIQNEGIQAVIAMDRKWAANYIYVDQGYGDMQVETMWRRDKHNNLGLNLKQRLHSIHGNQVVEIPDPRNGGEFIKKPAKPFMVDLLASWVSAHRIILPKSEDTHTPLVETEIPFLDIGIVQQMRNFRIEKYSPTGQPRYSQGYEHTLMALCFAVMGAAMHFSEINDRHVDSTIHTSNKPLDSGSSAENSETVDEDKLAARQRGEIVDNASIYQKTAPGRTGIETPKPLGATVGVPMDQLAVIQQLVEGKVRVGLPSRSTRPSRSTAKASRTIP